MVANPAGFHVGHGSGWSYCEALFYEVLQRWRVVLFARRLGSGPGDSGAL